MYKDPRNWIVTAVEAHSFSRKVSPKIHRLKEKLHYPQNSLIIALILCRIIKVNRGSLTMSLFKVLKKVSIFIATSHLS